MFYLTYARILRKRHYGVQEINSGIAYIKFRLQGVGVQHILISPNANQKTKAMEVGVNLSDDAWS